MMGSLMHATEAHDDLFIQEKAALSREARAVELHAGKWVAAYQNRILGYFKSYAEAAAAGDAASEGELFYVRFLGHENLYGLNYRQYGRSHNLKYIERKGFVELVEDETDEAFDEIISEIMTSET